MEGFVKNSDDSGDEWNDVDECERDEKLIEENSAKPRISQDHQTKQVDPDPDDRKG